MRFTIFLQPQEAEALRAAAEAEKRDLRDEVVWLALKALREEQQSCDQEGGNEQQATAR